MPNWKAVFLAGIAVMLAAPAAGAGEAPEESEGQAVGADPGRGDLQRIPVKPGSSSLFD